MCGEQLGALLLLFRNYADRISVGASEPRIQRAAAANARCAGKTGMDLLNVLLDLADAISAGVAIAGFWYTWVVPSDDRRLAPGSASGPDELERFILAAALIRPSSHRLT
jgi:hypothetical protein